MVDDPEVKCSLQDVQNGFDGLMIKSGSNKAVRTSRCCNAQICMVNFVQTVNNIYQWLAIVNKPLRHPCAVIGVRVDILNDLFPCRIYFCFFSGREKYPFLFLN